MNMDDFSDGKRISSNGAKYFSPTVLYNCTENHDTEKNIRVNVSENPFNYNSSKEIAFSSPELLKTSPAIYCEPCNCTLLACNQEERNIRCQGSLEYTKDEWSKSEIKDVSSPSFTLLNVSNYCGHISDSNSNTIPVSWRSFDSRSLVVESPDLKDVPKHEFITACYCTYVRNGSHVIRREAQKWVHARCEIMEYTTSTNSGRNDKGSGNQNVTPKTVLYQTQPKLGRQHEDKKKTEQLKADCKKGNSKPKRFHCPHCEVSCSNHGQLRGHIRKHTGEKPHACCYEGCNRKFARNEELTRHKRIHTGAKPYCCEKCPKRFGRKDHLRKHQKTHLHPEPKKTFVCIVCNQEYSRPDALKRHYDMAHTGSTMIENAEIASFDYPV